VVDVVEELGSDAFLYGHTDIGGKKTTIVAARRGLASSASRQGTTVKRDSPDPERAHAFLGRGRAKRPGRLTLVVRARMVMAAWSCSVRKFIERVKTNRQGTTFPNDDAPGGGAPPGAANRCVRCL